MNKFSIPILISALICSGSALAEDKYDYIATPVATQIDDLRDEDDDGVINARDLCPKTAVGAEVDNDGCGTYIKSSDKMNLHILFANDSSVVQPMFSRQIRDMSEFLESYPSTSIELQGYASKVGRAEYNLALSKRRAEAVQRMLINNGVSPERVSIVGYGDTRTSGEVDDEATQAQNRKVVASVVGHKGHVKEEWTIFTKLGN
ncbi:OmpA family protein [Vibrio japonicus]|uniref:OmpA family protein n=1 Tax=Vibrio japonicus TaxID=1824638 RepID=A0ABY5LEV2_9VIBR|nr:OmpA family protein [Vibrio japonicus]UUM29460.1 OmpA family protein [Vibrio japonicus]